MLGRTMLFPGCCCCCEREPALGLRGEHTLRAGLVRAAALARLWRGERVGRGEERRLEMGVEALMEGRMLLRAGVGVMMLAGGGAPDSPPLELKLSLLWGPPPAGWWWWWWAAAWSLLSAGRGTWYAIAWLSLVLALRPACSGAASCARAVEARGGGAPAVNPPRRPPTLATLLPMVEEAGGPP